ncbi:MAG: hypothetical protein LBC59_05505 [Chitinispirillales bacterium]|jgi:hypothetical protein|nr:hypothetical protein [Chitinispirillales bacterium]
MDTNTNTNKAILYARFDRSFVFEFALLVFLSPPLIVLWSFVAYYFYLSGAISFPILKVAAYYSGGFALALLLYGNNRATRRGMGVVLDGERIVKRDGSGVSLVDYADIRGVDCTKNPLFNKKMAVTLATGKAMLPLNLRGSYKMVGTIFEKLAALGQFNENDKVAAAVKRRLFATAMQYNALYKVRGKYIQSLISVLALSALFNGMVASLYWERGLATALGWGFTGMLFQALGYLAAERLWAWRLYGSAVDKNRVIGVLNDQEGYDLFRSTHAAAAVTALLVSMVAGIAVTLPAM